MKVVAGLGNPGKRYEKTPHNAGFLAVDELASRWSAKWRRSFRMKSRVCRARAGEIPVALLKPQTYMNNSGIAVASALRYWKVGAEDLVVVLDDADLEPGQLRVRLKGSSGGHRGLDSVIQHVGSTEFARVRVGVGRSEGNRELVDHVLKPLGAAGEKWMERVVMSVADAVACLLTEGGQAAMNKFNGLRVEK